MSSFPEIKKATLILKSSETNENKSEIQDDEIVTDIVVQSFTDRHVVIITQLGKLGTIINAESDLSSNSANIIDGKKTYTMNTLLGKRNDPLFDVYARQIIERIAITSDKPLLLTIALVESGRGVKYMEAILNKIMEIKTW